MGSARGHSFQSSRTRQFIHANRHVSLAGIEAGARPDPVRRSMPRSKVQGFRILGASHAFAVAPIVPSSPRGSRESMAPAKEHATLPPDLSERHSLRYYAAAAA